MAGNAAAASGLAVAVLLVLAACGGAGSANTTVVTVTNVSTVTSAQTGTVTSGSSFAATRHYARFRMPSKNVGCGLDASVLRCDILSGLVPEPTQACELDWTGFVLEASGPAQPECAGDTVYDVNTPVLAYGERWSKNGITCESREAGLRCQNKDGHGFTLARGASTTF